MFLVSLLYTNLLIIFPNLKISHSPFCTTFPFFFFCIPLYFTEFLYFPIRSILGSSSHPLDKKGRVYPSTLVDLHFCAEDHRSYAIPRVIDLRDQPRVNRKLQASLAVESRTKVPETFPYFNVFKTRFKKMFHLTNFFLSSKPALAHQQILK